VYIDVGKPDRKSLFRAPDLKEIKILLKIIFDLAEEIKVSKLVLKNILVEK
jgi:hypothetical protein